MNDNHKVTDILEGKWRLLFAILLGALYPLGFAPLNWLPLPLVSVAGFWWLLKYSSPEKAFKTGLFYGIGLYAVGVSWVYVSINVFGNASMPLAIFLTALFVVILGSFYGVLAKIFVRYCRNYSVLTKVIAFALLWLLHDAFKATPIINFPWLYLGYSQTGQGLMGLASIFGVQGITVFLMFIALFAVEIILVKTKKIRWMLCYAGMMVAIFAISFVGFNGAIKKDDSLTVALIQPDIDQHKKWQSQYFGDIVSGLVEQSESYWGADILVWPEAAIPSLSSNVDWLLDELEQQAKNSGTDFITGIPIDVRAERINMFAGIKVLGNNPSEYHKQRLVPFGEYLPFQSLLRGLIDFFDLPMSSFTPGDTNQKGLETEKAYLIPAICYEIAFPELIQRMSINDSQKPKAILTISNDTWFGKSWGPLQHFQMAQMRAIENGLPVIRGTNNGITALIDHYGRVIDQEPRFEKAVLAGVLPLTQRTTIFNQYGHVPFWGLCLALLGLMLVFRNRKP